MRNFNFEIVFQIKVFDWYLSRSSLNMWPCVFNSRHTWILKKKNGNASDRTMSGIQRFEAKGCLSDTDWNVTHLQLRRWWSFVPVKLQVVRYCSSKVGRLHCYAWTRKERIRLWTASAFRCIVHHRLCVGRGLRKDYRVRSSNWGGRGRNEGTGTSSKVD